MSLPVPALEPIGDLTVLVAAPIEAGEVQGTMTHGRRRIIPITGGTLRGPVVDGVAMRGTVLPGGADFQIVVSETLADLEARYLIELDSGERIYVLNRAIRRGPAELIAKLVRGEPVDPALIYFRCAPSFEVSSTKLAWMTQSLFVGTGARYPDRVEISLFRVA
jgi:Protein of unknown function (DUF3237)